MFLRHIVKILTCHLHAFSALKCLRGKCISRDECTPKYPSYFWKRKCDLYATKCGMCGPGKASYRHMLLDVVGLNFNVWNMPGRRPRTPPGSISYCIIVAVYRIPCERWRVCGSFVAVLQKDLLCESTMESIVVYFFMQDSVLQF